jgi:hypothetical protein
VGIGLVLEGEGNVEELEIEDCVVTSGVASNMNEQGVRARESD